MSQPMREVSARVFPSFHGQDFQGQERLMIRLGVLLGVGMLWCWMGLQAGDMPKVGDEARNFSLRDAGGKEVELKGLWSRGPVVVLFLRGYPGYQCPLCTKQVLDFRGKAKEFGDLKTTLVLVYPGPAGELKQRSSEFLASGAKELPENVVFVTDPDFGVTKEWGLRWEAEGETAYPSTFVIDESGKIRFAKISKTHGGRTKGMEILGEVKKLSGEG